MADLNSIQFKRIITTKVRPTAAQLLEGELAINLADGRIYTKDSSNIVKSLSDFTHGGVITNNFLYDNILSPGFYYDTNLALSVGKPSTEITGTGYLLVFNTMDTTNESNVVVSNPGSVTTQMFIGGLSGYVWTRTKPTLTGAWTAWTRPIYNGDPVNLKDTVTLEATNAANGSSLIFKNASNTTIGYIKYVEATGLMFNAGVHTMTLNKTSGNLVVPGAVFEGANRVYSPNNIPATDVIWAVAKLANVNADLVVPGQWKVPVGILTNYPTLYTGNANRDGFIECIKTNTGLIQNYLSTAENVWYTRTSTNGTAWSVWTRLITIDTTELTKLTQISSSGLNVTGSITTPIVNATVGINTSRFNSATAFSFYTATSSAQYIYTGGLLASDVYSDGSKVPTNGIYSKGNILTIGTVTAPTFIGALTGNADSATRLQTARNFQWTGDATGLLSFNGTANVSAALTLANTGVGAGTYQSVTVDTKGRVTAANTVITGLISSSSTASTTSVATTNTNTYLNVVENTGGTLTSTGASIQVTGAGSVTVTSDNTGKITITGSQTVTGNAASATKLQTARNINGVSFDGTSDINIQPVAVRINGGSDLNNYITPGYYYCDADVAASNTANTPTNFSYSLVITKTAGIIQTYTSYNGAGNSVYVRGFYAGVWSAWKKIAFASDNITGNAATATKLQTARTINGVAFDGSSNINIADSTKLPLSGGTISGQLVAPNILINRSGTVASGISWYGSPYNSWQDYMAQAGSTGNGVCGNITAPTGTYVTIWARRSVIEPTAGYGWTFETMAMNGTAPSIVAELSINGTFKTAGDIHGATLTVSGNINATQFSSASPYSFLNGGAAQNIMTGGVLVSNSYADIPKVPTNGIYAKGIIRSDAGFQGKLLATDLRTLKPFNAENGGISAYFVTEWGLNNDYVGGNYGDFLSLNTYHDASAGLQNGLFFDKTGKRIVHYQSAFGGTSWGSGKTLAYAEDVLSINGGTMNAPITFNLSYADGAFHKLIEGSTSTDGGYIAVGNHGSDRGYLELGTIDDPDAAIYARKRNAANAVFDEAVILGPDGITSFPRSVYIHNTPGGHGTCGLVAGNGDNAAYGACNIDITSWFGVGIKSSNNGERTVVFNSRNGDISTRGSIHVEQVVNGRSLGVNNTEGAGAGLSLYNGATGGLPYYGISFAQTANFGTHGYVSGDWATYFTMEGAWNRGWIFRSHDYGNVASISSQGNVYFKGNINTTHNLEVTGNINVNGHITRGSSDIRTVEGSNYTLVYDYSTRIVRIIMKVMANLSIIETASPLKALDGVWIANFTLPISIKTRLSAEMQFNNTGLNATRWVDEASEWMTWCAPVGIRGSTENIVVVHTRRWTGTTDEKVDGYLVVTGIF